MSRALSSVERCRATYVGRRCVAFDQEIIVEGGRREYVYEVGSCSLKNYEMIDRAEL